MQLFAELGQMKSLDPASSDVQMQIKKFRNI